MTGINLPPATNHQPRRTSSPVLVLHTACTLASAWLVWTYAVLPRLQYESIAALIGEALFYVSLAWFSGAIVTLFLYLVMALADISELLPFSIRAAAPAMWFAPAFILLSAPALPTFVIGLILVANATRQMFARWVRIRTYREVAGAPTPARLLFDLSAPGARRVLQSFIPALSAAFTAQAGCVALAWNDTTLAGTCFTACAAILIARALVIGAYRPSAQPVMPPSVFSIFITLLLVLTISVGSIEVRRAVRSARFASGDSPVPQTTTVLEPVETSTAIGGGFPGVVLLPEVKPQVATVVPVRGPHLFAGPARPASIAFTGEYWMFEPPFSRPPYRSFVRRGRPSQLSFHTTNGAPLEMEAHQKLDPPVSISCCRAIQVTYMSADAWPGTVSLELILTSAETPGRTLSLGTRPAGATGDHTLTFPIPPAPSLQTFNEFKIVFHRAKTRADHSAKIAIERLVLLP